MKSIKICGLVLTISLFVSTSISAQDSVPTPTPQKRERITANPKVEIAKIETPPTTEKTPETKPDSDVVKQEDTSANKSATTPNSTDKNDEATPPPTDDPVTQAVSYYVNYVKEYRLGPEDVISVDVFGQPNYSKAGIIVPPTATIAYPLIPGGVSVAGKSTDQVSQEISRKLSEYIINPQVTVTLEKVGSARFSVMGDVAQPGIRLMTRRVTLMSALTEAGGVLPTGSKSKVVIYRNGADGLTQIPVNVDQILKAKANDIEIQPGDQIFIPGNKMKSFLGVVDIISRLSGFRTMMGTPR